jgi:hypothetical protein
MRKLVIPARKQVSSAMTFPERSRRDVKLSHFPIHAEMTILESSGHVILQSRIGKNLNKLFFREKV